MLNKPCESRRLSMPADGESGVSWCGCIQHHQSSLAFDLALHLARLFDARPTRVRNRKSGKWEYLGRHPNRRDEASIPLMIRLLRQKRCRNALIDRARNWHPHHDDWSKRLYASDCDKAIEKAIEHYSSLFRGKFGRSGIYELKKMRDTAMVILQSSRPNGR